MTEKEDVIAALASSEQADRYSAAVPLYARGCDLGNAATRAWWTDREITALLRGNPTVGIAVHPESFERIRAAFGSPRLADVPPDQDAQEFELHVPMPGGIALLDILTTRAPGAGGAIAKFLEKFGEGVQHVEYVISNVDRATLLIQTKFGVKPIYPQTRRGADGTRVNFFLAATPDGRKVLVELVEPASHS